MPFVMLFLSRLDADWESWGPGSVSVSVVASSLRSQDTFSIDKRAKT